MGQETHYKRLLVAPHGIRRGLVEFIEDEIEHQRAGRPAAIKIKVNSIVDETIADALYRASQAGVPVDLWVRGICTVMKSLGLASSELCATIDGTVPKM